MNILLFADAIGDTSSFEASLISIFVAKSEEGGSPPHDSHTKQKSKVVLVKSNTHADSISKLANQHFDLLVIYDLERGLILKEVNSIRAKHQKLPIIILSDKVDREEVRSIGVVGAARIDPTVGQLKHALSFILSNSLPDKTSMSIEKEINRSSDIFLVEDEEINRTIIKEILPSPEYSIKEFSTGAAFLKQLRHECPLVVLLDYYLPDLDGGDILFWIRQYFSKEELPVIIISAQKDMEIVKNLLSLGLSDYMTKPIDHDRLKVLIRDIKLLSPSDN
ncbi:MAG: response regulator [Bdellovibrionales bacterium]|jgi:DNA-binding response OmpR family regulator|nr:response regulator [Bdellovibrionales bacterium]MBT3525732.1 response regulator [Bdellovibrionales bacterium]MBT7669667.1 response regulator [Bdellovibrionales bacterium]MBT7765805.1 response regulator [Bdellovibrionales bacterium]